MLMQIVCSWSYPNVSDTPHDTKIFTHKIYNGCPTNMQQNENRSLGFIETLYMAAEQFVGLYTHPNLL